MTDDDILSSKPTDQDFVEYLQIIYGLASEEPNPEQLAAIKRDFSFCFEQKGSRPSHAELGDIVQTYCTSIGTCKRSGAKAGSLRVAIGELSSVYYHGSSRKE